MGDERHDRGARADDGRPRAAVSSMQVSDEFLLSFTCLTVEIGGL